MHAAAWRFHRLKSGCYTPAHSNKTFAGFLERQTALRQSWSPFRAARIEALVAKGIRTAQAVRASSRNAAKRASPSADCSRLTHRLYGITAHLQHARA
ncbi:MAG: hypothetical protein EPN57_09220 [Paraburkholderia sp.]|nr:MAG: hypothetical protein EPN57_09220 [Paraburkholderia sp.]